MSQRTRYGFDRKAGARRKPQSLIRPVRWPRECSKVDRADHPDGADAEVARESRGRRKAAVILAPEIRVKARPAPAAVKAPAGDVPAKEINQPKQEIKREVRAPSQAPRRAVIGQRQAAKAPPVMKEDPASRPDPPPPVKRKAKIRQSEIPSAMEVLAASWGKS